LFSFPNDDLSVSDLVLECLFESEMTFEFSASRLQNPAIYELQSTTCRCRIASMGFLLVHALPKLGGQSPFVRNHSAERSSPLCISVFALAPLLLLRDILCCQTMLLERMLMLVYLLNQLLLERLLVQLLLCLFPLLLIVMQPSVLRASFPASPLQ
jgi:hypothetical protein